MTGTYLSLDKLEVYQCARELGTIAWKMYEQLSWQDKKVFGDQFIRACDSVGANIAEGYGRFHYLDKVKFYYNARGSLLESRHWFALLVERKRSTSNQQFLDCYKNLRLGLNGLISSAMKAKNS